MINAKDAKIKSVTIYNSEQAKQKRKEYEEIENNRIKNFEKDHPDIVEQLNKEIEQACKRGEEHASLYFYPLLLNRDITLFLKSKGYKIEGGHAGDQIYFTW